MKTQDASSGLLMCRRNVRSTKSRRTGTAGFLLGTYYALLFITVACLTMSTTPGVFHVEAFAAAKKKSSGGGGGNSSKKNGPNSSSTNKGFGAPPPSLDDVLAKFPTRIPTTADSPANLDCPCGNPGRTYAECCGPLHDQTRTCTTMTDVLRSRYSAFCWRNVRHVMDTTHESCRDWRTDRIAWAKDLNREGMFDSFEFVNLNVGPEEPGSDENEGFIEFQVTMRGRDEGDDNNASGGRRSAAAVAGLETVVKERSKFLRDPDTGVWSYASGDVTSEVAGLEGTKLNN